MPLLVLYNPVCGDGTAQAFFEEHVLPLLQKSGKAVDLLVATQHPHHAGSVLVDFLQTHRGDDVQVVLGSGDGTLNECISAAVEFTGPRLVFALVPCGTANALYSTLFPPQSEASLHHPNYRLQSVKSLLIGSSTLPLHLAITTISSSPSAPKISAVVVSTSLHASILKDSEALRNEISGLDRFKVAAQQNSTRWYNSKVKLLPAPATQLVQIYDPSAQTFITHPQSDKDDSIVDIDGPFSYFLATVNVDRLEPAFVISPLASSMPPAEAVCDIVIVRPFRSTAVSTDTPETRAAFVQTLSKVLGAAYRNGSHVNLRYDTAGEVVEDGDGLTVVEYIRCGGWEWIPDPHDEPAHYLCTDGAISIIEYQGRAVCSAAAPGAFFVYV